jgi:AraC-like DNA-binding protein
MSDPGGQRASAGAILLAGRISSKRLWAPGRLRRLDSYGLVYVTRGSGWYNDDNGTEVDVEEGTLLLLTPSARHAYGPDRHGEWDEIYLTFAGRLFDSLFETGVLDASRPVFRLRPTERWQRRLDHLVRLQDDRFGGAPVVPAAELLLFLCEAAAEPLRQPRYDDQKRWLARVIGAIESTGGTLSLTELARSEGLEYDAFRKRFTRLAGFTPKAFCDRLVTDEACDMLRSSGLTISQVADELGFAYASHFSKFFRRRTGMSPHEYRMMHDAPRTRG